MPLAEDQRAMLQLLLEGGQSYADIGSLLGVDADEVRSRARAALTDMGGADPDAEVSLTDYLLGQADPIGRADAARFLQGDPAAASLATRLSAQLRLLAPNAQLPELPAGAAGAPATPPAPAPAAPATAPPTAQSPASPPAPPLAPTPSPIAHPSAPEPGAGARVAGGARSAVGGLGGAVRGLGGTDRRLPVALGAAAVLIVVLVILVVAGVFSGDDNSGDSGDQAAAGSSSDVTVVPLSPVNGSGAGGQATFSAAGDQPVAQLNLFGLEPSNKNSIYIVWFYNSDQAAIPFAYQQADKDGNLTGQIPIPAAVVSELPSVKEIRVTKVESSDAAQLSQAIKKQQAPPYVGDTVLKGDIPRSADAVTPTTPAP